MTVLYIEYVKEPDVFKSLFCQSRKNQGLFGKGLTNDKILVLSKLRTLADNKLNIAKMIISIFDRYENIVGKGENAGNQHFLLFPVFSKP